MNIDKIVLQEIILKLRRIVLSGKPTIYHLKEVVDDLENLAIDEKDAPGLLTKRQKELCFYLVKGFTNKEISSALNVSIKTVEFHLKSIYERLDCSNRSETIAFIVENQLLK